MRAITRFELDELLLKAKKSERKRANLSLHQPEDLLQRMLNALLPGTYMPPHKHENPDKYELVTILRGQITYLEFNAKGEVEVVVCLDAEGDIRVIEVPPRTYHTMIALQPSIVVEVTQGPYNPATHKIAAPWAPAEGTPKASDYLLHLESIVDNWDEK